MRSRRCTDYCGAQAEIVDAVEQIVHRTEHPTEDNRSSPVNRGVDGGNELELLADRQRIGVAAACCTHTDKGNGDQ